MMMMTMMMMMYRGRRKAQVGNQFLNVMKPSEIDPLAFLIHDMYVVPNTLAEEQVEECVVCWERPRG